MANKINNVGSETTEKTKKCCNCVHNNQGGSAVYGLGFIGAAVYFIGQASGFNLGVIGLLKALVWPAFLVYYALKFFVR
jgi:hypothetical protein